jgi:SPP1 gp7 family putative phage head morphogenesis protein
VAKTLKSVHANRGIETKYRAELQTLIDEMTNSYEYWLKAAYRKEPPRMAALVAQDASPTDYVKRALAGLAKRWIKRFDDYAPIIAAAYIPKQFKASDSAFMSALRDAGWTVKFKMTPAVRDALNASVQANVDLIKSIPMEYNEKIQGVVMRSYAAGRDLETMTADIQAVYPKTFERAAAIARDQSNKANATANRARQMELGITEAVWMHSHAGKTPRPDHVAANGKKYKIAQGCLISGEYIQPGFEINCRCTSRPIRPY